MFEQILGAIAAGGAGAQSAPRGPAPLSTEAKQGTSAPIAPTAPGQPGAAGKSGFWGGVEKFADTVDRLEHPERDIFKWVGGKLLPSEKPEDPRGSALGRLLTANGGTQNPQDSALFDMIWD